MTAIVLSPGPSLSRVTRHDLTGDVTIGVNRAVHALPCDWWAFGDDRMYRTYPAGYPLKISTNDESKRRLNLTDCLTWESIPLDVPQWRLFSFTAAIVTAWHLGASTIRIYGCDWAGVSDYDGHQYQFKDESAAVTRQPDRWERERNIYDAVVAELVKRDVKVERITYGHT